MREPHLPRPRHPLFQVNCESREGFVRVGPAMMREACEMLATSIAEQIKTGREKRWTNPQIVPLLTLEK